MATQPLKFLFQANFADGTFIQQTQADQSKLVPGKSAYRDVKERLAKGDELVSFGLFSDQTPETWVVDLRDGHFEMTGVPFRCEDPSIKLPEKPVYRVVYFRQVQLDFNPATLQQKGHRVAYFIGWQTNDANGKNIQQTISVK